VAAIHQCLFPKLICKEREIIEVWLSCKRKNGRWGELIKRRCNLIFNMKTFQERILMNWFLSFTFNLLSIYPESYKVELAGNILHVKLDGKAKPSNLIEGRKALGKR
jgi:hypothetical protein